ncbi:mechanosensitive ion channel family protein [Microvirga antarctica]|uniref:mechanosensitive ion channel family protein n=1 Tax=Microvirga antarctica TaxID=2819233 RepID=UPI001B30BF73|nr:mechanosensitive ion channel family protein [Microvirga antarctica]
MAEAELLNNDPTELVSRIEEASGTLEQGLIARLTSVRLIGDDWSAFQLSLGAKGLTIGTLVLLLVGTALLTYGLTRLAQRLMNRRHGDAKGWRRAGVRIGATLLVFAAMFLLTRFTVADLELRRILRIWVMAVTLYILVRAGLQSLFRGEVRDGAEDSRPGSEGFSRTIQFGILWGLLGIALTATLRIYDTGPALRDVVGTILVSIPAMLLLVYAYARHRHVVEALIAPPGTASRARQHIAASWPWIAIVVIVMTWIALQVGTTVGRPLPPLAIFSTLILVLIAPHLDRIVAQWIERGVNSPSLPIVAVALRKTTRFVVAIAIVCLLLYLWILPLLTALGIEAAEIARRVVEIGLISLAAAFLWNSVSAFTSRVAQSEGHSGTLVEVGGPRSRLGTLLPLLSGTIKIGLLCLTVLTILIAIGINVWPIVGGLSIFGIAIGFGSQTLVKDIVSGLFFLIDDAFRLGEYIEAPGAKGTVEKISVRSVSLRNARGALASVPYGQIGKVVNFSRGWVIEKFAFRVAFDTDVEKVRKMFKEIGKSIAEDPELQPDLLETFKSQGISAVEDGTLIIRGKFKARAGQQFAIKKAVLTAVQKGFCENGIEVVSSPYGPPGSFKK